MPDAKRCLQRCNTNAKLVIKQNDKPVTVCQELFEKIQIKKAQQRRKAQTILSVEKWA